MSRQDQENVTVSMSYRVGGQLQTRDLGTFDGFSGGAITSESTKFHPGGMAQPVSLGGRRTVDDFTVSRLYDLTRDHPLAGWIAGGVGKADIVAVRNKLTVDGISTGRPLVYRGKLMTFTPPDHDSESSDAALFELEVSSATMTQ